MFAYNIQPYYFSRHKCQQHFSVLSLHFIVLVGSCPDALSMLAGMHWQGIINAHQKRIIKVTGNAHMFVCIINALLQYIIDAHLCC